jgi:heat-inducible transcriptional repressor
MSQTKDITSNERYLEIFRKLMDVYVETGEPVGSRVISKKLDHQLSPATIRNVMSDLEEFGILCSDHSSAGRKPTIKGWRFFVDSLIEVADISEMERQAFQCVQRESAGKSVESVLDRVTDVLSTFSNCVSLVLAPKFNTTIRQIDFILLTPGRGIIVIINESGAVENRLINLSPDISQDDLEKATRYINSKLPGLSLVELRNTIQDQFDCQKEGIDERTKELVDNELETIGDGARRADRVIVNGRSSLISNASEISDLQDLLQKLDEKNTLKMLLEGAIDGQGVKVFIGAETKIFELVGCSMVVAPYRNTSKTLVGAIGVLGPSRMKYDKVMTLVDYTARLVESII